MFDLYSLIVGLLLVAVAFRLAGGSRSTDLVALCAISGAFGGFLIWSALQ